MDGVHKAQSKSARVWTRTQGQLGSVVCSILLFPPEVIWFPIVATGLGVFGLGSSRLEEYRKICGVLRLLSVMLSEDSRCLALRDSMLA